MQLKSLSLSIITTLTLIGCGGGGGGDSTASNDQGTDAGSTEENKDFQQWHYFELNEYDSQLVLNQGIVTFDQGKIYSESSSELTDDDLNNEYYVTQNGIYHEFGPKHAKYGHLGGTATFKNGVLTHSLYSPVGSTGLTFTRTFNKIDLSNKNVLATLEPSDQWEIENGSDSNISTLRKTYYNRVKKLTFPAGSYCYQSQKSSNSQEYIWLYGKDDANNITQYQQSLADFSANKKNIFKKTYKDTLAYLHSINGTEADATWGYAEYQGNYYGVERYPQGLEFERDKEIQRLKDELDSNLSAEDRAKAIQRIESANNECNWFNDKATKFILDNMKP